MWCVEELELRAQSHGTAEPVGRAALQNGWSIEPEGEEGLGGRRG